MSIQSDLWNVKTAANKTFELTPMKDATNAMAAADIGTAVNNWKCGPGTAATKIDAKYLPGSCRAS